MISKRCKRTETIPASNLIITDITTKNLHWQIRLVVNYSPLCSFLHSLSCGCIFSICLRQCSRRKCEDFLMRGKEQLPKQGCFPLCQNFWIIRSRNKWNAFHFRIEIFRSKRSTSRAGPLWQVSAVRRKITVPFAKISFAVPVRWDVIKILVET